MRTTEELRELPSYGSMIIKGESCGLPREMVWVTKNDLLAIADRIDAEHESACAEAYGNGVMSVPIALDESAWVELPKDADGEVIHVGDRLEHTNGIFTVTDMTIGFDGIWRAWDGENGLTVRLAKCRHYHEPTVEDVLREFVTEFNRDDTELCDDEVIERFAAKLRLAGGDAE